MLDRDIFNGLITKYAKKALDFTVVMVPIIGKVTLCISYDRMYFHIVKFVLIPWSLFLHDEPLERVKVLYF